MFLLWSLTSLNSLIGSDLEEGNSIEKRCQEGGHTKRRMTIGNRTETTYHIHKDATARYAPYLRHVQLPTYKLSLATCLYGQWLTEGDLNN